MNYEAERAMNQKRLRMDEPGHGVVQGNGLPLNYMDNGHQIPYQPYAGAYNTHYPPPDAFSAYGPPPPGGYAPQNLSYAPPAHQNYPHHQAFAQQPPQAQLHMPQSHMVQGYADVGMHKAGWPPQAHLLPPLDTQKPLDVKQLKPEIKLEPTESQKRPHPENEIMGGDLEQPKIKIKTDIFKPDELALRPDVEKTLEAIKPVDATQKPPEQQKDETQVTPAIEKVGDTSADGIQVNATEKPASDTQKPVILTATPEKTEERKPFSPEFNKAPTTPSKVSTPGSEPKKRGRPKGSTNKPKPAVPITPGSVPRGPPPPRTAQPPPRPRATGYQYAIRPFRKDFSGIQFRRRWSDECLDSSHIPNEVYFGDVPVSMEVLFNYYDANAEREKLAAQAAHIAAQKAAAAKLQAAKLQAKGITPPTHEVTTVDSSSEEESGSGSDASDSDDSDEETPIKKTPGRPKGAKTSTTPKPPGTGKRGRPPVPPDQREPGVTDMKKFCKAAGIRFDYKKLTDGCTKNKERVNKMMDLLVQAGLEGKPTMDKCKALKQAKIDKKEKEKQAKKKPKVEVKEEEPTDTSSRRMTRGATGVKPRQRIVISSDEEDDTPAARKTISKIRSSVNDESDSD